MDARPGLFKSATTAVRDGGGDEERLEIYHEHTAVTSFFVYNLKLYSSIIEVPGFRDRHRPNIISERTIYTRGNNEQQPVFCTTM
jgi:hypothetical protein